VFTKARLLFLSLARLIQSTPSYPVTLRYILLLATVELFVAARSTAWVCGRLLAEIAGSNPAGGMDVFFCQYCLYCRVKVSAMDRSLFQRNPSEFVVSEYDFEISTMRSPRPTRAVEP
jgi:hypothetical protein